jgi:hypothetical protein
MYEKGGEGERRDISFCALFHGGCGLSDSEEWHRRSNIIDLMIDNVSEVQHLVHKVLGRRKLVQERNNDECNVRKTKMGQNFFFFGAPKQDYAKTTF